MTVTLGLQTTYNMVLEVLRNNQKAALNQQLASQISTLIFLIQRFPCIH
jgi:hypothetical protein